MAAAHQSVPLLSMDELRSPTSRDSPFTDPTRADHLFCSSSPMYRHSTFTDTTRVEHFSPASLMYRDSSYTDSPKSERPFCPSYRQSTELAVEQLRPSSPPSSKRSLARSIAIVATCTGVTLVNTLNSISVSISLPDIQKSINIQEDQLQWLLSAYSLSSGCLLLLFGRLADLYGRKKVYLFGMIWQTIFAIALGFSSSGITLDVLRGFQGIGAAASIPAALGILATSFPPSRARSIAFATFTAGAPIGGAFGTIIGGVLTQLSKEHWRSPFFLSAGLSVLCVIGALLSIEADGVPSEIDPRVDWLGAFLVSSGLVLLVFVLGQGPTAGWTNPYIIACLILGVILLAGFIAWELHLEKTEMDPDKPMSFWTPPPLMKLTMWARAKGRMAVILVVGLLTWAGFVSWSFWVQLYYQNYVGLTPIRTMICFIPMFITGCFCNLFVAMAVSRLTLVVLIVIGTFLTGFACVLFALINPSATYWAFGFPSSVIVVFGADFVLSAGSLFVAKVAFPHEQSLAGGMFQTMSRVGTSIGLGVSTIVFNSVIEKQSAQLGVIVNPSGSNAPLSAQLQGYKAAQWTSGAFPLLAAVLAIITLRGVGTVGHSRQPAQRDSPEESAVSSQTEAPDSQP